MRPQRKSALMWYEYPVRVCRTMHECRLCWETIELGESYRDGGYGKRAHVGCVERMVAAPATDTGKG
jgi:hypothetical protein